MKDEGQGMSDLRSGRPPSSLILHLSSFGIELEIAMSRKMLIGLLLLATAVTVTGCGPRTDSRRVPLQLVDHFRKNGLKGRYQRLNAKGIGAVEGGQYGSREQGFLVEFAKFEDPRKAAILAKKGFRSKNSDRVYPCYANGQFVMIVRQRPVDKNVVKIFKSF
jgi:hypothetical protein